MTGGGDRASPRSEVLSIAAITYAPPMIPPEGEDIPPTEWVTQTGHLDAKYSSMWTRVTMSFRSALRVEMEEDYISVLLGRVRVEDAVPMVSRGDQAGPADAVRYASAGALQKEGFRVVAMPLNTMPSHVAVYWDDEWTREVSMSFSSCFTDYVQGVME